MSDLERFLADNPSKSPRDWKGKGFHAFAPFEKDYVGPHELPWDQLDRDDVRRAATRTKARFLTRGQRMAAGRDPGLLFDERSRSYRLRDEATPAPQAASGGDVEGVGAIECSRTTSTRPASAIGRNDRAQIARIFDND